MKTLTRVIAGFAARLKGISSGAPRQGDGNRYFHLDTPKRRRLTLAKTPFKISGWAVDLNACTPINVRVHLGGRVYPCSPKERGDVQRAFSAQGTLPAECGFELILDNNLRGAQLLKVEIEAADRSWRPMHRSILIDRSVFGHRRRKIATYKAAVKAQRRITEEEIPELKRHIHVMLQKPQFSVVIDEKDAAGVSNTVQSIRDQIYPHWDINILASGALSDTARRAGKVVSEAAISQLAGDFIVFLRSGDRLDRRGLYEFASALNAWPELDLIYADQDSISAKGERRNPFYKPDWSPDYLEAFNYIGYPACFRTSLCAGCCEAGHYYDFVLRFTERTDRIHHVPAVLCHCSEPGMEIAKAREQVEQDIAALGARLSRTGRCGVVTQRTHFSRSYDITISLKQRPLVSIVIPTADKTVRLRGRDVNLITNCVSVLRERSTYKNIEIIVVDNGDLSRQKMVALEAYGCKFITYRERAFNAAKKLNLGASIARGEMLLLLNDDIEIIEPSWIERMLEHFEKDHVGVVGAKLLYPKGETQHVGVVHNSGNPDHVRRLYPCNDEGYFFSTGGARNFTAVTGACMMTPSKIFQRVGGYSEELAVSYNDVDYCMKVRSLGLYVVYAPPAELLHFESQSRKASLNIDEANWYQKRWAREVGSDPFYNERFLSVAPPTFEPIVNPRLL